MVSPHPIGSLVFDGVEVGAAGASEVQRSIIARDLYCPESDVR